MLHRHSTASVRPRSSTNAAATHPQRSRASASSHVRSLAAAAPSSTVTVTFTDEGASTTATVGEDLMEVAARCNVYIPTGCLSGSCGICEVEVAKLVDSSAVDPSPAVIRACIAKVPPGYAELRVKNMEDGIWGQDGFDT